MRCSAYNCINNDAGYCTVSDYVSIDKEGECTEYELMATNRTTQFNREKD